MIFNTATVRLLVLLLVLAVLAGCRASGNRRAPVEERDSSARKAQMTAKKLSQREQDAGVKLYVIQKGDTLYSIAFDNGLDYREIAEQNNIENPAAIQIGQQIKLLPSEDLPRERPRVESKPGTPVAPLLIVRKVQPKLGKLPYSEQAVAQIERMQLESASPVPATPIAVVTVPTVKPVPQEASSGPDDTLEWGMPTRGKVIAEYSESGNRKGVDFSGIKGQPVLASESGKVVYSGSGLRGYGKLVIIKHNKTFLSAYAHNEQILVREGQSVSKGQKIAEMGNTDADQVKLHFEIRKFGKPVDPAKFLNLSKS
ncbi:MAG: peptidoglycan DD-metalloendopeptidase family protein [Gallionellaceae bacterium]|jgi:lipoprotein NlpD